MPKQRKTTKLKTVWRKNFDIKRVDYNLAYESLIGFTGDMVAKTLGFNPLKKGVWVFSNGDCEACYFPKNQLRRVIQLTLQEILLHPGRIKAVHKTAVKLNWQLFRLAQKMRNLNFSVMSNKQILAARQRLYKIIHTSHMWSIVTTWFVDSDGEDFSNYLLTFLKNRVQSLGLSLELASAFSILTTPQGTSFTQQEEEESLKLLSEFRKSPTVRHWFSTHTTAELVTTFNALPAGVRRKIFAHYQKWLWLPYTYIGPAWGVDYFLEVWRGLIHEDFDPKARLSELLNKRRQIQQQRLQLIKQLQLSETERTWFDIAAEIVGVKGFRKEVYFFAFYVLDLLLAEVARRAGLTLLQAKYLVPGNPMAKHAQLRDGEIADALFGKDFSSITNNRINFSVLYAVSGKVKVLEGLAAKKFLAGLRLEKLKITPTNLLAGTCACAGKAVGRVKVVNVPADIPKMKAGDIMLAHTTFPALVPAMKKAAAIVTEDGGITCHAAIVARELQTPCVVGVKGLLVALKDGDLVEVNANQGRVRKLS